MALTRGSSFVCSRMVIRPVASAHVNASHPALLRFDGGSKLKVLSLGARLNSLANNNGSAAARSTAICFLLRSSPRWNVATALSSSRLEKSQPREEAGAIADVSLLGPRRALSGSSRGGGTSSGRLSKKEALRSEKERIQPCRVSAAPASPLYAKGSEVEIEPYEAKVHPPLRAGSHGVSSLAGAQISAAATPPSSFRQLSGSTGPLFARAHALCRRSHQARLRLCYSGS